MPGFDFDAIIDRRGTNAVSVEAARSSVGLSGAGLPRADDALIRMWVADMDFAPPDVVTDAIRARLDRRILGYTGHFDGKLYDALSGWCAGRHGWSFAKEQLVFSSGVVAAIWQIAEDVAGPGDGIIILTPSYAPFARAAERSGAELICSPLKKTEGRYEIDFDDLAEKAADPRTKLLIFCNPHNPTGRIWTPEELRAVGELAAENGLWLISDEIHCDLTRMGIVYHPMAAILPDYERLVVCLSASKTFNIAGLSLSEIIIRDEQERRRFTAAQKGGVLNPLSMAAHEAAFSQGGPWLDALRTYLDGNFALTEAFLRERLPRAGHYTPEATYLLWPELSAYVPADRAPAAFFAEKAGVILEDASSFVGNADGCVRMNLAMPRALLREGLERIARACT